MYCLNYTTDKYIDTIEENYFPLVFLSSPFLSVIILDGLYRN